MFIVIIFVMPVDIANFNPILGIMLHQTLFGPKGRDYRSLVYIYLQPVMYIIVIIKLVFNFILFHINH